MKIITEVYKTLTLNGLVKDKADFSLKWARRNSNWLSYTEHKKREAGLEAMLNIRMALDNHIRYFEGRKSKMGWLADEKIKALRDIRERIDSYILDRYRITQIEMKAA